MPMDSVPRGRPGPRASTRERSMSALPRRRPTRPVPGVAARLRRWFRPDLERMEDRTVPAAVRPGDLGDWTVNLTGEPLTARAGFVTGPAIPPLGSGSLQLTVGNNGDGIAEVI